MSAGSTLDPDAGGRPRSQAPGHDTRSLGPSDSSDGGSDVAGGPGMLDSEQIGLDTGTNEDPDGGRLRSDAGGDIGDMGLDSETDRGGTGENVTAGRDDAAGVNRDHDVDRLVDADEAGLGGGLDQAEEANSGVSGPYGSERTDKRP